MYYNFRYYSPELGRWLSRAPIGEYSGLNLYAFVINNPLYWWDYLGLDWSDIDNIVKKRLEQCKAIKDQCKRRSCEKRIYKTFFEWFKAQEKSDNKEYWDAISDAFHGTLSIGVTGSAIAGSGTNATLGLYYNTKTGDYGGYLTLGGGIGYNIGAGFEAGYMQGGVENFAGSAVVVSGALPKGAGGSVVIPLDNPAHTGGTFSFTPWGARGGGSITTERTFTFGTDGVRL